MQDKNLILAKIYTHFKILLLKSDAIFGLHLHIEDLNIIHDKCEYKLLIIHNIDVVKSFLYNKNFPEKLCKLYELSYSNLYKIYQYLNSNLYE